MKLRILPFLAIFLIFLLFPACSPAVEPGAPIGPGGTSPQTSVGVFCDDFRSQPRRSQALNVPTGSTFTVVLCTDATKGIQWSESAQISDQTVVQQTSHEFISLEKTGIVGATGNDVWTFKALKRGPSTIAMECVQTREHGEKGEWAFNLTVFVE